MLLEEEHTAGLQGPGQAPGSCSSVVTLSVSMPRCLVVLGVAWLQGLPGALGSPVCVSRLDVNRLRVNLRVKC